MRIEILTDCKASKDGINLESFFEGEIATVSETFGKMMIDSGFAGYYKEYRVSVPELTPEKQTTKQQKTLKRNK